MMSTINDRLELSLLVKKLRKEKSISQEQLSQFAGISRQTLSEIERGNADFQISTLLKIIKLLGCKLIVEEVKR